MMLGCTGDPFTRFLPPEEGRAFENATEGETVSLGLQISVLPDERVRVAVVIEGSPAERAGVLPGDFLLAVNGRPVDPSDKMCGLLHPWGEGGFVDSSDGMCGLLHPWGRRGVDRGVGRD